MTVKEDIVNYKPFNDQEYYDKKNILDLMDTYKDIFYRTNKIAHMTASCWLVNNDYSQVLMCFHRIYNSWSWLGGHADGNTNLLEVAIKEAKEESGLNSIKVVDDNIFSLEVLSVDSHIKNNEYVPTHLHLNLTYLLQADDLDLLHHKDDENKGVKWFKLDEAVKASNEIWFRENIYRKLNNKLRSMYENH